MLAILNLSPSEITIAVVVAVVVFGRRLPEVAGQVANAVQRMRRSMDDLRRETGIDKEIRNARRAVQDIVPKDLRTRFPPGQESPPPQLPSPAQAGPAAAQDAGDGEQSSEPPRADDVQGERASEG